MRIYVEKILDIIAEYIKSVISNKYRSYYELSEKSEKQNKKNPISTFLSEKVRIKMDVEISRGVLILILTAIVVLFIFIIRGIIKSKKK